MAREGKKEQKQVKESGHQLPSIPQCLTWAANRVKRWEGGEELAEDRELGWEAESRRQSRQSGSHCSNACEHFHHSHIPPTFTISFVIWGQRAILCTQSFGKKKVRYGGWHQLRAAEWQVHGWSPALRAHPHPSPAQGPSTPASLQLITGGQSSS